MNQLIHEEGSAAFEPLLRGLMRPLVAVAGAAVSAAAGVSAVWAVGARPVIARRRASSARSRRGRI